MITVVIIHARLRRAVVVVVAIVSVLRRGVVAAVAVSSIRIAIRLIAPIVR